MKELIHIFDENTLVYGSETGCWYGKCKYCGYDLKSGSFPGYAYKDKVKGVYRYEISRGTACTSIPIMEVLEFSKDGFGGNLMCGFRVRYKDCPKWIKNPRKNQKRIIRIRSPRIVFKNEKSRGKSKEDI